MQIKEIIQTFSSDPFWQFKTVAPMDAGLYESFKKKFSPPEDFMTMLSLANGFSLFMGDYHFNSIPEILYIAKLGGLRPGILDTGTFHDLALVIDLEKSHTKEYLYVGPTCSTGPFACTGTITDFLNDVLLARDGIIPRWRTPWDGEDFAEEWPPASRG